MDLFGRAIPFGPIVADLVEVSRQDQAIIFQLLESKSDLRSGQIWEQFSPRLDAVVGPEPAIVLVVLIRGVLRAPPDNVLVEHRSVHADARCYLGIKAVHQGTSF